MNPPAAIFKGIVGVETNEQAKRPKPVSHIWYNWLNYKVVPFGRELNCLHLVLQHVRNVRQEKH